jgi:hypothetical protein
MRKPPGPVRPAVKATPQLKFFARRNRAVSQSVLFVRVRADAGIPIVSAIRDYVFRVIARCDFRDRLDITI